MTKNPLQWLAEDRGINPDLLAAMDVRAVDHPKLGPCVAFMYRRGGEPYAAKFRTVEGKRWASSQGVSRGWYNEDDIKRMKGQPLVITEGEIDCLSVMQAGHERCISLPDGWNEQGNKTDLMMDWADDFRCAPYVIVAGDNDQAGESLPRTVANVLRGHDVRFVTWPEGCKDANDVLVKYGEGELARCLTTARHMDPEGGSITGFGDMPPLSAKRVLRLNTKTFQRVVALECGALSIWTGTPGSGKSTFLTWVAERVSKIENIRVGMFAFETDPRALRDQLSCIRTGQMFDALDAHEQKKLTDDLDQRFRVVHRVYDQVAHRMQWLEETIYTLAIRDRCKLIIVDPWNELEHMPEPGESMTNYINWALQRMRQIAESLEVHIALVAHPKKVEDGKVPGGYDIADSAAFFNKPSLGVTVHQAKNEDGEPVVRLKVWKVRNTRLYGFHKGTHTVSFDEVRQSYAAIEFNSI